MNILNNLPDSLKRHADSQEHLAQAMDRFMNEYGALLWLVLLGIGIVMIWAMTREHK